jgi:hypothetical protein
MATLPDQPEIHGLRRYLCAPMLEAVLVLADVAAVLDSLLEAELFG